VLAGHAGAGAGAGEAPWPGLGRCVELVSAALPPPPSSQLKTSFIRCASAVSFICPSPAPVLALLAYRSPPSSS
jgi:hypothetical protein